MAKNTRTSIFNRTIPGGVHLFEDMSRSTGNRFFVDSGATTFGDGTTPDAPFATVDAALGSNITTDNGDIIYAMPGHAETLSTAAQLTLDKAGVLIQGLGWGSSKPTFTITTGAVAAPILWTADNCILDNIRIVGGQAGGSDVTMTISGDNNQFSNSELISTSTTELGIGAALGVITIDDSSAAVTEILFKNITHKGGAGNDESFLTVNDGTNGATEVTLDGCVINGTFADNTIQADQGTDVNTEWYINNCILGNAGGDNLVITLDTTAIWYITNTTIFGADSTTKPIVGANASYVSNVWTCESGAAGGTALNQTVTNWGA